MLFRLRHLFRRRNPAVVIVPAADAVTLTPRERTEIRQWLELPTTRKVLGVLESRHPGLHTAAITKHARSEWDQHAVVNFINRIAGWESYRNALLTLADAPQARGEPVETYPSQN